MKPDYKIAVAGLVKAGKTSIMRRLLMGRFERTTPTAGFDSETFEYSKINLQVTDLGGHDVFIHTLWKAFIPKAKILIYVLDANDHASFVKSRDTLHFALSWNTDLPMLIILANKQDLPSAASKEEILERFDITTILSENNIKKFRIFETSAKSGMGINEAFDWMAEQLTDQKKIPIVNIHMAYVLQKKGLPVHSSENTLTEITRVRVKNPESDRLLLSGFYSAISTYINEFFENKIQTLVINGPSNKEFKLVSIVKGDFNCLLVVELNDDLKVVRSVGFELLDYIIQQDENNLTVEDTVIRRILSTFLESTDEDSALVSCVKREELPVTEKKTVTELVGELDSVYVRNKYQSGAIDFFTKMSVMDRIRTIEN